MRNSTIGLLLLATALGAAALSAHNFRAGSIAINHPWTRETAAGQADGGGFMKLTNNGRSPDKLMSATSPASREVQLHNMTMVGGVMRMRQVTGGIALPAGKVVELKPGSYHIMFIGLKKPLTKGSKVPVTLKFQHAGKVNVQFAVRAITLTGPQEEPHGGH